MHEVDLQDLLKDYENNLCDRIFEYELSNSQIVQISFYREQLCHLLGIQYVFGHNRHFLGSEGFGKIKNGKLTTEKLKKHNKAKYEFIKERLYNFKEIKQLMENGQLIKFYCDRARPTTKIQADFIIFQEENAHIIHLFLRKEQKDKNVYAPVSFVIKSIDDKNANQFIANQEYKQIVRRTVKNKS